MAIETGDLPITAGEIEVEATFEIQIDLKIINIKLTIHL